MQKSDGWGFAWFWTFLGVIAVVFGGVGIWIMRTDKNSMRVNNALEPIRPMSKKIYMVATILAASFLSACTAEQMYGSLHGWQANQCNRIPDKADADRCLASAPQTYDSYKRQSAPEAK